MASSVGDTAPVSDMDNASPGSWDDQTPSSSLPQGEPGPLGDWGQDPMAGDSFGENPMDGDAQGAKPLHEEPLSAQSGLEAPDQEFPRGELEGALQEFAPELRVVDRGLILRADLRADSALASGLQESSQREETERSEHWIGDLIVDWVCVDPTGRMNLVVWLGSDRAALPAEPTDLALEILHRVREQMPFILRHLGTQGVQARVAPRLVAIATHFTEGTVRKLAVLGDERVRLLEVHGVESESGASYHLVQRWPFEAEQAATSPERFLERLHGDLRTVAQSVLESLQHVDERVVVLGAGQDLLEWNLLNQTLCRIEQDQGELRGRVGGEGLLTPLDEESAQRFLESVLRRYFDVVSHDPEKEPLDGSLASQGESLVDQGLGVVLSAEEMDAFR